MSLAPDRDLFFNASDSPAMLGISPYEKRDDLLARIKYGISKPVTPEVQKRFDEGHRIEALARPIAEALLGCKLPPKRFTKGRLGATLDGYYCDDALNSVAWECKSLNDVIRAAFVAALHGNQTVSPTSVSHVIRLPEYLCVQMEQQLICSDADRCLFTASNGVETVHCWYEIDTVMRGRILEGWAQFERDFSAMPDVMPMRTIEGQLMPVLRSFPQLPALQFGLVTGKTEVLKQFEQDSRQFVQTINQNLQTDQDFADGESDKKELIECVARLDALIDSPQDLATLKRIRELFNKARLALEKQLTERKLARKAEAIFAARKAYETHVKSLDLEPYISVHMDFSPAVKGLSNISSMQNALTAALLKAQSEATTLAAKVRANLALIAAANNDLLFPNLGELVKKETADVANHISVTLAKNAAKIESDHKANEILKAAHLESLKDRDAAKAAEANSNRWRDNYDCPPNRNNVQPTPPTSPSAKINSLDDFLRSIGCDARYQMTNAEIKKTITWLTEKLRS